MNRLRLRSLLLSRALKHEIRGLSTVSKQTPSRSTFHSVSSIPQITKLPAWRHFATTAAEETEETEETEEQQVEAVKVDDNEVDEAFFRGPSADVRQADYPTLYIKHRELVAVGEEDVGKMFTCDEDLLVQHPLKSRWISKSVAELFEMSGKYLMLRQGSYNLIQAFKDIMHSNTDVAERGSVIGVYGARGSGKSVTLHTLNQTALQHPDKWLVIGFDAKDVSVDHHGFLYPSPSRDGIHMQGRWCKNFFAQTLEAQADLLLKVQLKREYAYDWVLRGETGHLAGHELEDAKAQMDKIGTTKLAGKTLHDLLTYGASDSALAGECFYDFVEELILADEVHTLVTLDSVNEWDQKSEFRDPLNPYKKLEQRQLGAVDALTRLMKVGPKNGMCVFATTSTATLNKAKTHMEEATYALEVPTYSPDELRQCVWHYKVSKFLFAEVDPFFVARVKGMTGGVPRDVFNDCSLI